MPVPSVKEARLDLPLVFVGFVDKTDPKITSERDMFSEQIAWARVIGQNSPAAVPLGSVAWIPVGRTGR